jgi:hypothetical protein
MPVTRRHNAHHNALKFRGFSRTLKSGKAGRGAFRDIAHRERARIEPRESFRCGRFYPEVFVLLRTRRDLLPFELIQDNFVN